MLKYRLLHPEVLEALAATGHGARVLIADANFPIATRTPARARRVHLNLAPDLLRVTDVLSVLADAIDVEAATVMVPDSGEEPSIFAEFRALLPNLSIQGVGREGFYRLAEGPDVALAIATGERRTYANLLLTIGVVMAE
jgi:L-fucose mutarotase